MIRTSATRAESAAAELAHKGRGFLGRRESQAGKAIEEFVGKALSLPPGAALPRHVRDEVDTCIEHTIDALETYVSREGARSPRRASHDMGMVKQVYALQEARQHIRRSQLDPDGSSPHFRNSL